MLGEEQVEYFVPDIRCAEELGVQAGMQDKFGGLPWGLSIDMWPKCEECGKPQSLLAQFGHDKYRLNLGREGRVLFIFQCAHDPGMCDTWDAHSGANACFVCEPETLTASTTAPPSAPNPADHEVRVVNWERRKDSVPNESAAAFFDESRLDALADAVRESVTLSTRVGGVPRWIQSPAETPDPGEGWRFVAQLDSTYSFLRAPTARVDWISADAERYEGRTHVADGPNFGDGGLAYVFLRDTDGLPEGLVFWQCS